MGRGPGYEGDIRAEITKLADRGWPATRIVAELGKEGSEFAGRDLPELRTVQRYVKRRRTERGEAWSSAEAGPEEVRAVLEVLAVAIEESDGSTSSISRDEAAWIMKVKATVAAMPPKAVWEFVKDYMAAKDTAHLDMALAVASRVRSLRSGGFELDDSEIKRHVKLHVNAWIDRPLMFWAGSERACNTYIDQVGHHASLVKHGDYSGYLVRATDYSWYDPNDCYGRLIIDLGKGALG